MAFEGLTLNGNFLSRQTLISSDSTLDNRSEADFESQAVGFCRKWLSGEESFQVMTSGSTGLPKKIKLNREQMSLSARLTGEALRLQAGDRSLVCLSPAHIAGLMMLVRGMVLDLKLDVVEPASNPFASYRGSQIPPFDFTALVPMQLHAALTADRNEKKALDRMNAILVGGAALPLATERQAAQLNSKVYQTFGMTETVSHIALRRLSAARQDQSYEALPQVKLGQDARNCLTVLSPLTDGKLVVTNDLVELSSATSFRWLGRLDNVINSGGIKIQAEKVERAVSMALAALDDTKQPGVSHVVVAAPDGRLGEMVVAVFESRPFSPEKERQLKSLLARNLHRHELPQKFCYLPEFARTSTGKIARQAVRSQLVSRHDFCD